MTKHFIALLLFLTVQLTFGQQNFPVKIPGTTYSLIPPDGFELSSNFTGFYNATNGASIMINELPAPYRELINSFTAEALKTKGITLINKETVDLNNSKATLLYLTQPSNGITYFKQLLLFGNDSKTTMINGIYPESGKNIETAIKNSMFTIKESALLNSNPEESVKFSIDISGTEFKFTKNISGTLLYTIDGVIPSDKPLLLVGNSVANVTTQNKQKYAEERLKKIPDAENSQIKSSTKIIIDGLNGFELIAENKTGNNKELIYEVMLFDNDGYYLIIGTAREKSNELLTTYKKIAQTFKRK